MKELLCLIGILTFCLTACGKKKAAAPLPIGNTEISQLKVSPTGVKEVQKVFDLYSKTGKLSLREISNICHRISPKLSDYVAKLEIEDTVGMRYTAEEFFLYLGESNRVIKWMLSYDLESEQGWSRLTATEFEGADKGIEQEALRLIKLMRAELTTRDQIGKFLSRILRTGAVYNILESFQFSEGSVPSSLVKYYFLHHAKELGSITELSDSNTNLIKLSIILEYLLLEENLKTTSALDSKTPSTKALRSKRDRVTAWSLNRMREVITKNYASLNADILDQMYLEHLTEALRRMTSKDLKHSAHNFLHPKAYAKFGDKSSTDKIDDWRLYDAFELIVNSCPELKVPTWDEWANIFRQKVDGPNLNFMSENFCKELKDNGL